MSTKKEVRFVTGKGLEIRTADDGKRTMSGMAALYNSRSLDLGGFSEILAPGAFKRTLADPKSDVCALMVTICRRACLAAPPVALYASAPTMKA